MQQRVFSILMSMGLIISFGMPQLAEARKPLKKNKIHGELRAELNAVLAAAADLQEVSYVGNDQKTTGAIRNLVKRIDSARSKTHLAKAQRMHLLKILEATKGHLQQSRRTAGAGRNTQIQGALKQIVVLAQAYQLDNYRIFFCPKDKSTWLQRARKPQNPVNPTTYGSCGTMVN